MINFQKIDQVNWAGTTISILGGGMSGIAAAKLGRYIGADIFISDIDNSQYMIDKICEFKYEVGEHTSRVLEADLVIISPGIPDQIPIILDCKQQGIPIVSEIEFAFWFTSSPILALTGSNGKTTTVNLLHDMCISDGRNSLLGGNVGIPFSENVLWEIESIMTNTIHVLEISSFQLEHIHSFNPMIAGLLNISEDHLNRYDNIHNYYRQKFRIAENVMSPGWIIYNADDTVLSDSFSKKDRTMQFSTHDNLKSHYKLNASKIYSGSIENPDILFHLDETKLRGSHNIQNILAAATMAHAFGLSSESIRDAITNFTPIPHRLEWIGHIDGVDYFNDSKATNIAAARAAIESFDNQIVLILGGQDKGTTDYCQLSTSLTNRVKHIIAYGQAGELITNQLNSEFAMTYIEQFERAVIQASKLSKPGDTILLSPACASFDQFRNYEERGNEFKIIFNRLELNI